MHNGGHNRSEKKTKETIEKIKGGGIRSRHHHKSSMGTKGSVYGNKGKLTLFIII